MSEKFEFNYTAPTDAEKREIESIRRNYVDTPESVGDVLQRLRYLDNKVKNPPVMWGLVLGILGIMIFGLGLSMILEWRIIFWGVLVSLLGIVPIALAYPVYKKVYDKGKTKYKDEILELSEKLLSNKN